MSENEKLVERFEQFEQGWERPVRFLGALAPNDPRAGQAKAALLGVPYDGAVTYRGGARFGPRELRIASDSIETYCPKLDLDLADHLYVDLGDLDCSPPELVLGEEGEPLDGMMMSEIFFELSLMPFIVSTTWPTTSPPLMATVEAPSAS